MNCFRYNCVCLSLITGILAGVILGVLYALGFVATEIVFWAYLAVGVAGVLLSPVYAARSACEGIGRCFCNYKNLILAGAIGTIVAAVVGLIVAPIASTTVVAIVLGLTTFFAVVLLVSVICLVTCLCDS